MRVLGYDRAEATKHLFDGLMEFAFAGVAVKHVSKDRREFFINLRQDTELPFVNLPDCYIRARIIPDIGGQS